MSVCTGINEILRYLLFNYPAVVACATELWNLKLQLNALKMQNSVLVINACRRERGRPVNGPQATRLRQRNACGSMGVFHQQGPRARELDGTCHTSRLLSTNFVCTNPHGFVN
jgi:hypothetical protein